MPNNFKIGFAGNIGKAQDMKTLIAAAEILKDQNISWVIAGDGSDKIFLDQEIQKRNLQNQIITVGRKSYSEMLPFFQTCDAMLVTLTDEFIFSLTIPSKVQAYMSSGRPMIASVPGEGARIVLEANAGLSCQAENAKALAETVLKMKNLSSVDREKMGKNGEEYFKKYFERSVVIDQIEKILKHQMQVSK